jgi:LacI family transcriptional regulator, galactose operon repressor
MIKRNEKMRRVSQQDIAREANVSRVTVSLVLSGKDETSQETRQRVLEAAKRLRYRPNLLVQGMQTGRSGTVGVIAPVALPFHGQIAYGIHDELVKSEFVPMQLWADPSAKTKITELEQIHRLVDRRVDGMIIWPLDASVPDVHFNEIWERHIPLVTIDRETTTHADHVGTDEEHGGRLAAQHLLKLGHRRVAHLTYPDRPGSVSRRRHAFVKAIEEGGGECFVASGEQTELSDLAHALLKRSPRPTAVFAATDPMALKVYAAASAQRLRIPQDISVIGYADFSFAAELIPPLTTVRQDPYTIGRTAARMLMDRILDRHPSPTPQHIHLKPELVLRKSTASVG